MLLLYLVLIGRGLLIAGTTREPFGRQLVVGCIALIAAQVIINCGMTVGLMPITGITLPLVSYGGSSLLFLALLAAMVALACFNIWRKVRRRNRNQY